MSFRAWVLVAVTSLMIGGMGETAGASARPPGMVRPPSGGTGVGSSSNHTNGPRPPAPPKAERPSESAGGRITTWQTKERRVPATEKSAAVVEKRSKPYQQNSKTVSGPNAGEHRFYEPRTGKEGAALAKARRNRGK